MKRRDFLGALAGAAALPIAANAQRAAMPVVGFLRSSPAAPFANIVAAFRRGLKETGYSEGQNVAIEQRWADNRLERLPDLAAELIRLGARVIVGNGQAIEPVKRATTTIPLVFVIGDDPVGLGLVPSLSHPGGNVTGITFFGNQLSAKRTGLLLELVPKANVIALLIDPNFFASASDLRDVEEATRASAKKVVVVKAAHERDFEAAFATMVQAGADALIVGGSAFFTSQRRAIVALAARHALPAIYDVRDYVAAGGLISYAASFTDAYRQAGVYAGRILKGDKPSELPVLQPTTFELVINLKAAKALGLTVPPTLLARTDEVIE